MNEKGKEVLEKCPNFNRIVNFDYAKDDQITAKLITIYRDYIFKVNLEDEQETKSITDIDYVLGRYIDDYQFRRELRCEIVHVKIKKGLTFFESLKAIVYSILHIFDNYLENSTRRISIARWI